MSELDEARKALATDLPEMEADEITHYTDQAAGFAEGLIDRGVTLNEDILSGLMFGTALCGALGGSTSLTMSLGIDSAFEGYMTFLFILKAYDEQQAAVTA